MLTRNPKGREEAQFPEPLRVSMFEKNTSLFAIQQQQQAEESFSKVVETFKRKDDSHNFQQCRIDEQQEKEEFSYE